MKKIEKSQIEKQVRKEYKEARQWCKQDYGRYYKMMIDIDDGQIWSDTFLTTNDWNEYHSESITSLETVPGYAQEIELGYVEDAVRKLQAAGWEIEE